MQENEDFVVVDWHNKNDLLSRKANEDDVPIEIKKLMNSNTNYRHETQSAK